MTLHFPLPTTDQCTARSKTQFRNLEDLHQSLDLVSGRLSVELTPNFFFFCRFEAVVSKRWMDFKRQLSGSLKHVIADEHQHFPLLASHCTYHLAIYVAPFLASCRSADEYTISVVVSCLQDSAQNLILR